MQHLRLQFQMELQKKKEEIQKLIANQRGKSQQIENLEKEHRVQKKKLEARVEHHQSEKICALEAQLSNRITLHQQELQAQAYAFAAKLRQCENEKCEQLVAVRSEQAATIAATEERHRAELGPGDLCSESPKSRGAPESKVKELEAELAGLKKQTSHSREYLSIKKDEESNSKMDKIIAVYEDQIRDLKARLKREDELERVKEDLSKKHALELQSFKMQKAREIDQVSERVVSCGESGGYHSAAQRRACQTAAAAAATGFMFAGHLVMDSSLPLVPPLCFEN